MLTLQCKPAGQICILSDNVANTTAAGKLVTRLEPIGRKLLDSSLDADATNLRVAVEKGDRRLIRITDDGMGMIRGGALLAFERHATGKLSDVKDLESIATPAIVPAAPSKTTVRLLGERTQEAVK